MCYTTGVRQGDHEAGRTVAPGLPRGTGPTLVAAAAWLLAAGVVGSSGWFAALSPPAPQLVLAGLTIALLLAVRLWSPLRQFVATVDLRALVLFHVTRFVGFYFLALHARGDLPWAFAVPGGWGDNAVAATALLLVPLARPDTHGGRRAYLAWNVLGAPRHPRSDPDRGPARLRGPRVDASIAAASPLAPADVRRTGHHRDPRPDAHPAGAPGAGTLRGRPNVASAADWRFPGLEIKVGVSACLVSSGSKSPRS